MLVLSRKQNEKIRIGSDIVINIVSVSENQVKIGIEAPPDVKILREELYENVKKSVIEASELSKDAMPDELAKLKLKKIQSGKKEGK